MEDRRWKMEDRKESRSLNKFTILNLCFFLFSPFYCFLSIFHFLSSIFIIISRRLTGILEGK